MLTRGSWDGIYVPNDGREAEIRDACSTRVVNKDIPLAGRQHRCEIWIRTGTNSFQVPVDNVAGMQIAETPRDIGYLKLG